MPAGKTAHDSDNTPPITGEIVRRYRRLLGLQQSEFAGRWGLTQGALSQIESGRLAISEERAALLAETFKGKAGETPFVRFLQQFTSQRRQSLPLVGHPAATYATLTVWRWTDDLDLAADPLGLEPAGLVTLRLDPGVRALAIEIPAENGGSETLVFTPAAFVDLQSGDFVLYQSSGETPAGAAIASVEQKGQTSSRRTRFRPILPQRGKPREVHPSDLAGLLRCTYRGRYL